MISVVVPCYNVKRFLSGFKISLSKQTFRDFEVIFVNDGSSDGTEEELLKLFGGEKKVKIISQPNGGPAKARNTGLAAAEGEYITFSDADDVLAPNHLETLYNTLGDADVAVCGIKWVSEKFPESKGKSIGKFKVKSYTGNESVICRLLSGKTFTYSLCNKLYRREILKKSGKFNESLFYGEDSEFNYRYFCRCEKVNVNALKTYLYRQRKGGQVHSKFKPRMLTAISGIEEHLSEELSKPVARHIKSFICVLCIEMLFRMFACGYKDKEHIRQTLLRYKNYCGALFTARYFALYRRIFIPAVYPVFKLLMLPRLLRRTKRLPAT